MKQIVQLEQRAEACRAAADWAGAIAALQELLELDPRFARAHLALAMDYQKTGDFARAVQHAEKAVELEPQDGLNFSALSIIYQRAYEATRDPVYIEKAERARDRSHR